MKRPIAVLMIMILSAGVLVMNPDGEGAPVPTRDAGRILYVAPENSTYMDIDQALGDATEGDIIYVAPGTYENGMLISISNISVIGNQTEGDVIVGNNMEAIAGIHAGGVKVSGITFTDDHPHIGIMSMSGAGGSELTDVTFIATQVGEGLNIRDSENVTFRNITIRTNDRQALRIIRSQNISIENMDLSCNTSMGGCMELDEVDGLTINKGSIELRGDGTAIYNLAGGDLDLYDVTASYTEKFIMMETGNVSMYNMDIDPADILMDVPDPIHTVSSYFLRSVMVAGEGPDGEMIPLEGAELNITKDGMNIYSSEYYGGSDPTSGPDGYFPGEFPFLSWEKVGGEEGYRNGTNKVEAWFEGDTSAESIEEQVDANTTEDLVIELTNIFDQVRTLEGYITYLDGPMAGEFAANSTISIYNNTSSWNQTVNETGKFKIDGLPIGTDLAVYITPIDPYNEDLDVEAYIEYFIRINLTDDETRNFSISYFIPTDGSIFGFVRYSTGPKDGQFVEGAEIKLLNATGEELGTQTTDMNGYYEFPDIPFGEIYEVKVTPLESELGVNLNKTGYLPWDYGFWHNGSNRINASLKYYEHVEPASPHPEVTILDGEGEPVEGAQVDVTIEGVTYTAKTNMFGKAVFQDLNMEDFPPDAEFKASKEGFDDIEWKQGDEVPAIKESEKEKPVLLLIVLVLIVLLILAVAAFLIFLRKGPDEDIEE